MFFKKNELLEFAYRQIRYTILKRKFYGITSPFRKTPDFLVIGGKRCGTTTLFEFLKQHPMISSSPFDHMGFFDDNYKLGMNYYKSFFPFKTKKNLQNLDYDVTTSYLTNHKVPERISRYLPHVKIIVILRNPTSRAWSDYNSTKVNLSNIASFEEIIDYEIEKLNNFKKTKFVKDSPKIQNEFNFLEKGIYVDYLKTWFSYFPRENFLILSTEEFAKDENLIFQKIFNFLNIPNFEIKNLRRMSKGDYNEIELLIKSKLDIFFKSKNIELFELLKLKFDWN